MILPLGIIVRCSWELAFALAGVAEVISRSYVLNDIVVVLQ